MERTSRWTIALLGAGLGLGLAASGCAATPAQKCHQFVGEWQAAIDRCGFVDPRTGEPLEFVILHPDPPHAPVSCDNIGRVNEIREVETVCYPWLRDATCAEIENALIMGPIPECSAGHFEILVAR